MAYSFAPRLLFLTLFFIVFFQLAGFCQLKADFTVSKPGGCAPLAVSFTNTSTGTSASTVYEWNFGNGNSSSLKTPGAVFREEKTYTVILTVREGTQSASKSQIITVYKKPVADFSASLQKGCSPLPLEFTSNAAPGDGNISSYFWDFGDGNTEESSNNIITHTYTEAQSRDVSLTVTNSHGCQNTILKPKVVTILPSVTASFDADEKVLCSINDAAGFINNSKGPGQLSYNWNFGDATTSTAKEPSHIFAAPGAYTIELSVSSSEGCVAISEQKAFINAANFKSEIKAASPYCTGNYISLTNKSEPAPDKTLWEFGDGQAVNATGFPTIGHSYTNSGSYTIKLTNEFGTCKDVVTKTIIVQKSPVLDGFLVDITSLCGSPVKVNFKDTTATAVKWKWESDWDAGFSATTQQPSHVFAQDNTYYIALTITDAAGCSALASQEVEIRRPNVSITSPDTGPAGDIRVCGQKPVSFATTSFEEIVKFSWDFGDGTKSAETKPVHTYTQPGSYKVRLTYTTINGCSGTVEFYEYVYVRNKVKADFVASQTDVCGNTPVTFTNNSEKTDYNYWDFGSGNYQAATTEEFYNITQQFQEQGSYTIKLIVTDLVCADTMIKKDYIKVSPPFPKISGYTSSCEGTRGEVTFTQSSRQADTWHWDFGDGTSQFFDSNVPEVKHTYNKTGWYHIVLTNTNGQCTVKDSMYTPVLLKQNPIFSADQTELCAKEGFLNVSISNLERNPNSSSNFHHGYYINSYYRDGSVASPRYYSDDNETMPIRLKGTEFEAGKEGLKIITQSVHFGCYDTSNVITVKFKGPVAKFKTKTQPCKGGNVVVFEDLSKLDNSTPIKTWEWFFGDGPTETTTEPQISHNYIWSGRYYVSVIATDANGCSNVYSDTVYAGSSSVTASFTASAYTVSPGTTVDFTNTSTTSDEGNTIYKWILSGGNTTNSFNASEKFTISGVYTIKLISNNIASGCTDTATTKINVKNVNAAFTFNTSYISNSSCPPVLVQFTNTSSNVSQISWNFGDGTIVNNVFDPSHVYTKAGFYKITVTTYSDNGTSYTTEESIRIKEPSVNINADMLHGCTSQSVTLNTVGENASSYIWDFGDGTVTQAVDTFYTHHYQKAGVYTPHLIAKDADGCAASVSLTNKIVIDSLSVSLNHLPQKICTPKEIFFNAAVVSIGAGQAQQELKYYWDFGTGKPADISNLKEPSFVYQEPGTYKIILKTQSSFGCVKEVSHTVTALAGLGGKINGALEICQDKAAQFTGSSLLPWPNPIGRGFFMMGQQHQGQTAPVKTYNTPGTFPVKLVVDNKGCMDTVVASLVVHSKPPINLNVKEAIVCEGKGQLVMVAGSDAYSWSPAAGLSTVTGASVVAAPVNNTVYTVNATNNFGCTNASSVAISVAHPFTLQLPPEATVCIGASVSLQAGGANAYQWIQNTSGLSGTTIYNPVATPATTSTYTVVGSDAFNCFTDTAQIKVVVKDLPVIDAGASIELLSGTPYILKPVGSSDVIKWQWSPDKYLSCVNCMSPETRPAAPIEYKVTVTNAAGCTAWDTVSVKLFCSEGAVYIPNAITPNNDGINDKFKIQGSGVRQVKYLRIYNRWGEVVFERSNFMIDDVNAAWNGMYKGKIVPGGSYVYLVEMSCNEKTFSQKGTVTVIH